MRRAESNRKMKEKFNSYLTKTPDDDKRGDESDTLNDCCGLDVNDE